jgi:uncharacterized delta-60 repeat protein
VNAIAQQADGSLVVVGSADDADSKFLVVRYDTGGTPDPTFGVGGIVKTNIGPDFDAAQGVVVQPDGKIVVVGYSVQSTQARIVVVRYLSTGALDAGFGTGGAVQTVLSAGSSIALSVALQPDGKIVVGGEVFVTQGNVAFAVVRYDGTGALDTGFGVNGAVVTDFAFDTDIVNAVAVRPDGRIIAAGHHGGQFAAAQYLPTGSPDGAFGVGGKTLVDLVPAVDLAFDMVLQPDGKVVLAGYAQRGDFAANATDMAVVRLDAAGQPDATFAPGGGAVLRLGDYSSVTVGIARQADGKLVVAGYSDSSDTAGSFFIARLGGTCGNGVIDAPEQCDDANTGGLDCCTPGCALVPSGGSCEFDGNVCTSDTCDGAGTCNLGGPRSVCRAPTAPRKAKLAITDNADPSRDKLEFKWTKGVVPDFTVFGLPATFTSYRLCIFAGPGAAPPLVYQGEIPASSLWSQKGYKHLYKDKTGANDGFVLGLLQWAPSRPAKVVLKAKGANVAPPAPALATPVTAQLVNTSGECFGATFATPSVNAGGKFRASGQ